MGGADTNISDYSHQTTLYSIMNHLVTQDYCTVLWLMYDSNIHVRCTTTVLHIHVCIFTKIVILLAIHTC